MPWYVKNDDKEAKQIAALGLYLALLPLLWLNEGCIWMWTAGLQKTMMLLGTFALLLSDIS